MPKPQRLNIRQTVVKWTDALPKTWKSSGGVAINKEWLDLFTVIQEGLDSGEITVSGVSGVPGETPVVDNISFEEYNPTPWCKLFGIAGATVTATKESGVATVTFDKSMLWMQIEGTTADTNAGTLRVKIAGKGVTANTGRDNLNLPIVQKIDSSAKALSADPSETTPYKYDLDSSPEVTVVGVGDTANPSVTLRFLNIGSFNNFHLTFTKL